MIHKPRAVVADYSANPDHAPLWYDNIKSAEWKTPHVLQVGAQVAFIAQFMGRQLAYTYEIKEFIPGHKLVMRTAEVPFPMETTYTWETIAHGNTLMTLGNAGIPSGFSRLLAPMMASMMKRANKKDLEKLKSILERV